MFQLRMELARLKNQTWANDTAIETLAVIVKAAMLLQELPATKRTLQSPEMTRLFIDHCGRIWLRNSLIVASSVITKLSHALPAEVLLAQCRNSFVVGQHSTRKRFLS